MGTEVQIFEYKSTHVSPFPPPPPLHKYNSPRSSDNKASPSPPIPEFNPMLSYSKSNNINRGNRIEIPETWMHTIKQPNSRLVPQRVPREQRVV